MDPVSIGIVLAAVLAGPRLYGMVQSGQLDSTGALIRALVIVVVCIAGASYLGRLAEGYQQDRRRREAIEALTSAIEQQQAAEKQTDDA